MHYNTIFINFIYVSAVKLFKSHSFLYIYPTQMMLRVVTKRGFV